MMNMKPTRTTAHILPATLLLLAALAVTVASCTTDSISDHHPGAAPPVRFTTGMTAMSRNDIFQTDITCALRNIKIQ